MKKISTKKPMHMMLIICAFILFNVLAYHGIRAYLNNQKFEDNSNVISVVSAMKVPYEDWQPQIKAVGTLISPNGIVVTSEVSGIVDSVIAQSNQILKPGDPILTLGAEGDIALLHSLQAAAKLAEITYERDKEQYAINVISKATLDTDFYNMKMQEALVAVQADVVDSKIIRAPFAGKLGVFTFAPGVYLNPGDPIASLQALDPLDALFFIPEKHLPQLAISQVVKVQGDAYPNRDFTGTIIAVDPLIDKNTRNVKVQARMANPKEELLPGMFVRVEIMIGKPVAYLTIPQSAVSYNVYGNLVYLVVEETDKTPHKNKIKKSPPQLKVKQQFITTGETRGDQIQVLKGLKEGDRIVTSGQLKLKNNARVTINNELVPSNDSNPQVTNSANTHGKGMNK